MEHPTTSYDAVPYSSRPYYHCHPDFHATLASLLGMKVASPAACRVLEIGCAEGGNLIPLALQFPESRFLGIDLSPKQIAQGQKVQESLGIRNLELRAASLTEIDASWGHFDYLLCHGVYSWVPPPLQDTILRICSENLAPTGLAYISYNTYPGWYLKRTLRDLMLLHASRFEDPGTRVHQARAILEFFAKNLSHPTTPISQHYREQVESLLKEPDHYLFHEYLESENHPCYFSEFAARVQAHGLQYVGDTYHAIERQDLTPGLREALSDLSENLIQREQFHDFLVHRTFRGSVLCRAEVHLDRTPGPEILAPLYASSRVMPVSAEPEIFSDRPETFRNNKGEEITTGQVLAKVIFLCLGQVAPNALPFDVLWSRVRAALAEHGRLTPDLAESGRALAAQFLLQAYLNRAVWLHVTPFRVTTQPGDRPRAFSLARLQAEWGHPEVTNLCHRVVSLESFDLTVLRLLDGSRDRSTIIQQLTQLAVEGQLAVDRDGEPLRDPEVLASALVDPLEDSLKRLAGRSLLQA